MKQYVCFNQKQLEMNVIISAGIIAMLTFASSLDVNSQQGGMADLRDGLMLPIMENHKMMDLQLRIR